MQFSNFLAPIIEAPPSPKLPLTRKRSASVDSDKHNPHKVNLKDPPPLPEITVKNTAVDDELDGSTMTFTEINEDVKSRLITLQVSKSSLSLYSTGTKKLLFEKKMQNISFCTKV